MKKFFTLLAAMMIAISMNAKTEEGTTVTFEINPPMSCSNCESKIKSNLRFEKGVSAIEANAPGNHVTITYDSKKTDDEKLVKAFSKLGYQAVPCYEAPAINLEEISDGNCCEKKGCSSEKAVNKEAQCEKKQACPGTATGCCGGNSCKEKK